MREPVDPPEQESEILARHQVARTSDLREASDVVGRVVARSPLRMTLVSRDTPLDLRVNAIQLDALSASYIRLGAQVRIEVPELTHFYVNLPFSGLFDWRAGRVRVRSRPGIGSVLGPARNGEVLISGESAHLCLALPRRNIERELERYLDRELDRDLEFAPVMDLSAPSIRTLLRLLSLLHRELDRPAGLLEHPLAARTAANTFIDGLLLAQPHNFSQVLEATVPRGSHSAVRQAIDLIEAYPARQWSVGELASEVHVSVRALQDGFTRTMQMSPMQYLRRVRMSRVRDELLAAAPEETTVSEVATRWGFLHHGRFAAAYRARFGEPPSQTLKAGAPTAR